MKRVFTLWLPVFLCAGIIFYSSSMTYQQQDIRPSIAHYVSPAFVKHTFSWVDFQYGLHEISVAKLGPAGFIEFFIRKGAHVTVYFVLGILLYRLFSYYGFSKGKVFWYTVLLSAAYASSDEIHQFFTGNRTPLWQDSVLDTCGCLLGIFIYSVLTGSKTHNSSL